MHKPIIYIASPYTKGDPAINTHFQCKVFDDLMNDGVVWPFIPLANHFVNIVVPRLAEDWYDYDKALLPLFDACLRLDAELSRLEYYATESLGADGDSPTSPSRGPPMNFVLKVTILAS